MSAKGYYRGHSIVWENEQWLYEDTKGPITEERACLKCGELPTSEGHDACLGRIEGVTSACCGHGKEPAYSMPGRCLCKDVETGCCCGHGKRKGYIGVIEADITRMLGMGYFRYVDKDDTFYPTFKTIA